MKIGLLICIATMLSCAMNGNASDLRSGTARPRLSAQEIAARKASLDELTKHALERERANRALSPYHAAIKAATDPETGNLHLDRLPPEVRAQHEAAVARDMERQQRDEGPTALFVGLVGERPPWELRRILSAAVAGFNGLHHQRWNRDQCVSRMREMLADTKVSDAQLELLLGVGSLKDLWRRP